MEAEKSQRAQGQSEQQQRAGFGNPRFCDLLSPSLTSVLIDPYEQGWTAAEVMRDQIIGKDVGEIRRVPPGELQPRASTRKLLTEDPLVLAAIRWLERTSPEDWKVKALCRTLHCSPITLRRRFHRELHRTPMEEISRRRLERVREHLLSRKESVTTIALESGFTDSAHLSREFKKVFGLPPGTFRKQHARS